MRKRKGWLVRVAGHDWRPEQICRAWVLHERARRSGSRRVSEPCPRECKRVLAGDGSARVLLSAWRNDVQTPLTSRRPEGLCQRRACGCRRPSADADIDGERKAFRQMIDRRHACRQTPAVLWRCLGHRCAATIQQRNLPIARSATDGGGRIKSRQRPASLTEARCLGQPESTRGASMIRRSASISEQVSWQSTPRMGQRPRQLRCIRWNRARRLSLGSERYTG